MKKLIFVLALLLMAVPALAQVPVVGVESVDTWLDDDPNFAVAEVFLEYDQNSVSSPVRAW
ncbi:MAG: hypothetical protein ACYSTX_03520, partial [Planctomycetota bacterium]